MKKITIIGLGYIGIPTATFFAKNGIEVVGVDINEARIRTLNNGEIGIVEPHLEDLFRSVVQNKMFHATMEPETSDAFIICVPTPFKDNYEPDISYIEAAVKNIVPKIKKGDLIILESTSPVGTTEKIAQIIKESRSD